MSMIWSSFSHKTNPDLISDEIRQIMDTVRLAGAESDLQHCIKFMCGWSTEFSLHRKTV